ncbi:hypothetical protein HPB51_003225 [Rhipicephalus microplus]|uniref:Tick transposon n=1 Tax=Rhipicephalus microplus TaxID=6941 RepID=A0A9J6EF01_RHIMP|nr:hypothetical protein HPB51_003225 [Rhipicephalus microplus]
MASRLIAGSTGGPPATRRDIALRMYNAVASARALYAQPPNCGTLPILPHHDPGLAITTTIPGIRAKRNTPQSVLQQETAAAIEQRLSGRLLIFTVGSVTADGAAAATCVVPALGLHGQCRLPFTASSTTAELTAIDLAADQLADLLPPTAAVLCDSRGCLRTLDYVAKRPRKPLAKAKEAHHPSTPVTTFVRAGDVAHFRIARHVHAFHPDSRVATGNPPRPLPRTGIGRRARAFLLRLRTDCSRTAELHFRRSNSGSPACSECPADETIEHVLLQCPGNADQRRRLFDAYGRLGLPHVVRQCRTIDDDGQWETMLLSPEPDEQLWTIRWAEDAVRMMGSWLTPRRGIRTTKAAGFLQ